MFNLKQQVSATTKHFKVFLFENSSPQPLSEATLKEDKPKSVHRFLLDQNSVSFEDFVQKLKSKSIVTSADFKLFYLDDQNDWVSLSDEEDWKILNSILSSETVIKIVCQNIVPKSETESNTNPHSEFFKNFKWHGGRRGHCPFGNASPQTNAGCPWARGGCRRGFGASGAGLEQFAPLIENVVGSLFNGQQTQGANPLLGNLDLSSLLNNFFPGAAAQQESKQDDTSPQQEKESKENTQPPQFNGLNDLIKNFCGNLNEKVNNGSLNVPHFGIICDGCGKRNFTGSRWNCADCGDFDFCQECFETKANNHFDGFHSFNQVEPKAKSFLADFVKKMEGNQSSTEQQTETQPTQQQEATPQTETRERTEEVLPEEKLDEELYPSLDNTVPVTTSQLLSSQLEQPNVPVEQPVQPQPVVESTPVVEYAVEQQLLKDMGFVDEQANARLLKKHNGNIQRVITDLL